MSQRNFGEVKHALSNVVMAVKDNSTKLNLIRIQMAYLLKRVEKLEENAGIEPETPETSSANVLKNLSSINLS
tara:strand:- start:144 stop:362 length:219 start_codon:yes stop_codon:yes gene_type:complete